MAVGTMCFVFIAKCGTVHMISLVCDFHVKRIYTQFILTNMVQELVGI